MKKYLFIIFLAILTSCKKTSYGNCFGKEKKELLKEGLSVFEEMLTTFYSKKTIELSYEAYLKDLVASMSSLSNKKLDSVHKFENALLFLEKLKSNEQVKVFWKIEYIEYLNYSEGIGSKKELKPHVFMNTKNHLECLKNNSKTEDFKTFLNDYTEKFKDISFGVIASGFLDSERKKIIEKDKEVFKIFIAFHIYYETILINNL